ncbi:uncharacterized protein LOC110266840 [Arachis ipaensis]|uniref:uncharacterized protein LOC110266840 n=1 Tax=Arachis ipaensis TaxID=130454 RepID=UPI000A2B8760|nr:uncharacterized protein LOC110266840 [Arachis ipaensis]XP_025678454.1 uncharacterized protein LOC112778341 [Arachis hypogaea]
MGKSWKDMRLRLYDDYYEPTLSTEENIENRPPEIDRDHWRWYLDYRAKPETKSEQEGRIVERGELWIKVHKRRDGSYINDERACNRKDFWRLSNMMESSRVLSQNDSIAQVFGREKLGRVREVGFGPTPSQLFGTNLQPSVNRVQVEETQRKLNELQTELEAEKLKRKTMKDEAAADKKRIKVMESALIYLFQRQGEELPPEIAAGMCSME